MTANEQIVRRFFQAVDLLSAMDAIRSMRKFEREIGADHSTMYRLRNDYSRRVLQVGWLNVLVLQYGISADWLLTGRGAMFID